MRGKICPAQNALQHAVVIDHQEPPDAVVSELLHGEFNTVIQADRHHVLAHQLTDGRTRQIGFMACQCESDVAVGDHANRFACVGRRNHSAIRIVKDQDGLDDLALRRTRSRGDCHRLCNLEIGVDQVALASERIGCRIHGRRWAPRF